MKKKRKRRTGIQLVIFSLVAAVSILTVILVMGKLTRKKVNIDNYVIMLFLNHRSRAALHVCVVFLKIKQTLKK